MSNNSTLSRAKQSFEFSQSVTMLFDNLKRYAEAHRAAYQSPIGEDYVMGEYWLTMAGALLGLLNGETGKIDCGMMDGWIRKLAIENGFTKEQADNL